MESIEQLYNKARRAYILRLTTVIIIPYTLITFSITLLILNNESATINLLLRAIISSIIFGMGSTFIIMLTIFRKPKVLNHYNILYREFPNTNTSLLLLLSFYLIQNKKMYSLEKKHFFNKQMNFLSKSFNIKYNKHDDENIVQEILIFAKNTNFNDKND